MPKLLLRDYRQLHDCRLDGRVRRLRLPSGDPLARELYGAPGKSTPRGCVSRLCRARSELKSASCAKCLLSLECAAPPDLSQTCSAGAHVFLPFAELCRRVLQDWATQLVNGLAGNVAWFPEIGEGAPSPQYLVLAPHVQGMVLQSLDQAHRALIGVEVGHGVGYRYCLYASCPDPWCTEDFVCTQRYPMSTIFCDFRDLINTG
jgi:hypothetical protein